MTRDEIVRATYDVAERLNRVKRRHGLIDETTFAEVDFRLNVARLVLAETERQGDMTAEAHERLDRYIRLANQATMFGNDELKAPVRHRFRGGPAIAASLAHGLLTEISHTVARLAGRYDVAPLNGARQARAVLTSS